MLLIPLAIAAERADFNTWQSRLALPDFKENLNRHTPLHTTGTVLPPTITENLTLTAADNPIILVRETVVAPGTTLTLSDGAQLFAHEFAQLTIEGTLIIRGTPHHSIELTTNELHPDNQLWNGIILKAGAHADITHTTIQHASPTLTCLKNSTASLTNAKIFQTVMAIFTESPDCIVTNSRIYERSF